jgi:head-tail adaptor
MNGEHQRRGFASPMVNCRSNDECHGLIAWVSGKDCWARLEREREREREEEEEEEEDRDFKGKKE